MAELRGIYFKNGNDNGSQVSSFQSHHPRDPLKRNVTSKFGKGSYEIKSVGSSEGNVVKREDVPAVVLRNACMHYKKGVPVLQNLCMTVPKGAIYVLLGSSGCGKTSTVSCIVGTRKLSSGQAWVLGAKPGVKGGIGYMPQEISLFNDFSIAETLTYFGTLCGMQKQAALKETAFLTTLLRLPANGTQRVGTLSGGQKRRTSLAVSLINTPELVVLDEPTVGVDPLLRESIWNHLVRLSQERGTTILITSHHYSEASNSTMIGIMHHDGRLLVEQNPLTLLHRFNTTSLETVVLKLSLRQFKIGKLGSVCPKHIEDQDINQHEFDIDAPDDTPYIPPGEHFDSHTKMIDSAKRVSSLIHKNFVILFRNLFLFLFSVLLPGAIILIMCIAFKDDPKNLDFGVVNYEVSNASLCPTERRPPGECDIENLSCKFLDNIKSGVLNLAYYTTEEDAIQAIKAGDIWGFIKFPEEYSATFYERSASGSNVDDVVLQNSEIIVRMDQSNKNIYGRIKKVLHDAFEDYSKSILRDCGFDERQAEFALQYDTPIFGTDDTKFVNFIAPGVSLSWVYFYPIIAASIRYINEKKQGTFERTRVAGTQIWEILFSYTAAECITILLQSGIVYLILTVVIGVELLGSPIQAMLLLFLSSFGGVSMGLFIGSLVNEEIEAALLAMSLYFPNAFLSGVIWPVQSMPLFMQYVAYALPCTLTGESIRSVFSRGWSFSHPSVWPGYVSIVAWTVFYFLLTVLVQTLKNK